MGILETITDRLNRTKAELPALAVAGGLIFGVAAAYLTNWKEQCYPLQFSERTQIEQDARQNGREPSAMTLYHADALDMAMKVFEANNQGVLFPSDKDRHFAEKLKDKYTETKFHYNIENLSAGFESDVSRLKGQLKSAYEARPIASSGQNNLEASWKHTTQDQYLPLPETYTVSVSDGKGHSHTEVRTRIALKHVWTDHEYNLNKESARAAANSIRSLPYRLEVEDNGIAKPSRVNEENKRAILDSRKQADEKDKTDENKAEYIGISWGKNAKIPGLIGSAWNRISDAQGNLENLESAIGKAPAHAESRTYTPAAALATKGTVNSIVLGSMEGKSSRAPEGFDFYGGYKINLGAIVSDLNTAEKIWADSDQIVSKIRANLETLSKKSTLSKEDVKLACEVRELSEKLVETNFTDGIKVPSKRWYIPVLLGLAGVLLGGLLGVGIDKGAEAYGRRNSRGWQ
jgi:hypothetical protein